MTAEQFVAKWKAVTATEKAVAQTHFNELTALLGVPSPLDEDPEGKFYAFERHVRKAAKGKGFADVWRRGHFAWEYKAKGKDLGEAYRQLLLYRDDLENPPLLIVSNIDRIEVHTNFTGTNKAVYVYSLDDLLDSAKRAELARAWTEPAWFDPRERRAQITEAAATEIGRIALSLRERGHDPQRVAHSVMQLVFALFAEDAGLLPNKLVTKILQRAQNPQRVQDYLTQLFRAMSTGGEVLLEDVPRFNGGLFDGAEALPLSPEEITILYEAALLDWAEVEPAIFGTLFERSLDPEKRSQLGAHYTSRQDILRIVEPVVMQPLRRRWAEIRERAEAFLADPPADAKKAKAQRAKLVDGPIAEFLHHLHGLRVLDPACGSGNFLYVALQSLKDLEHEVVSFAENVGAPGLRLLGPRQFLGIEINPFARELASMVVWIGYLQWNRANGYTGLQEPILEPLENIVLHDALMNEDGSEYEWPRADFIIGNPPFLGDRRMRRALGHEYVERLRALFAGCIPGSSDLCCYWFEKARDAIAQRRSKRAGLLATNSIRGGNNNVVLQRIATSGGIFYAWSDEPWILEGAAVRVSIVGFDDGTDATRVLDGLAVSSISPQLTSSVNVLSAKPLTENQGLSFVGIQKGGAFDIPAEVAKAWRELPNASGRPNADVLRPFVNAIDLAQEPSNTWLIDFAQMPLEEAQLYDVPFEHVKRHVKPERDKARRAAHRHYWWRHHDTRPALRRGIRSLSRYIATPMTSKHRFFVWLDPGTLPSNAVIAIAREDDYTFGVLSSRIHEVWALALGTSLEDRPRYTPSTCFETFPFPNPSDEQRASVEAAAQHLDTVRRHLLAVGAPLTMTQLYNEVSDLRASGGSSARAYPLLLAHERLDMEVAASYGWEWPLPAEEILGHLLELNLERGPRGRD